MCVRDGRRAPAAAASCRSAGTGASAARPARERPADRLAGAPRRRFRSAGGRGLRRPEARSGVGGESGSAARFPEAAGRLAARHAADPSAVHPAVLAYAAAAGGSRVWSAPPFDDPPVPNGRRRDRVRDRFRPARPPAASALGRGARLQQWSEGEMAGSSRTPGRRGTALPSVAFSGWAGAALAALEFAASAARPCSARRTPSWRRRSRC